MIPNDPIFVAWYLFTLLSTAVFMATPIPISMISMRRMKIAGVLVIVNGLACVATVIHLGY